MKIGTVACKTLLNLLSVRPLTTTATTSVNRSHLLRVCTILFQQQNSPSPNLHRHLSNCDFDLTPEFFLQVCNNFPLSWRPVYRFFEYTEKNPSFAHSSTTLNKMLDIIGKSKNIDLFWQFLEQMGCKGFVTNKTFMIALKTLASSRELKKCVGFFHMMNELGFGYKLETLNCVVQCLCKDKLVDEASYLVEKLKSSIKPNGETYKWLIFGYCNTGELIEASKVWNIIVDQGLDLDFGVFEKMMDSLFKVNQFGEALKLFHVMRTKIDGDLGPSTYRLVIDWMCRKGKLEQARLVFDEMHERGIEPDNLTMGSLIYAFLTKGRIREAYMIMEGINNPDISVYHGMIKGLLRLKKAGEATQVFREMIKRGCEPIMHTYVMLLQGHLGKRGRKGSDPLVNFDTIFVGGLVKAGKSLEATKYVERVLNRGLEVPRFDYYNFLHYYSNEEGVVMFEVMAKKLREVGLFDLADIFERYGEKMATRERRRNRTLKPGKELQVIAVPLVIMSR